MLSEGQFAAGAALIAFALAALAAGVAQAAIVTIAWLGWAFAIATYDAWLSAQTGDGSDPEEESYY
jgi:hypothetical protein